MQHECELGGNEGCHEQQTIHTAENRTESP